MTCIVGIAQDGVVYMGGDSAGVAGYSMMLRADPKIFVNGEFLMGFTTSFRMGQLLEHNLSVPKRSPQMDAFSYMVRVFVPAVRDCLTSGGWATTKDGAERGGSFLVGYQGRLFGIEDDFQVMDPLDQFFAVGCGSDIALGSLYSTSQLKPKKRVLLALQASAEYSAGVRAPFLVKKK